MRRALISALVISYLGLFAHVASGGVHPTQTEGDSPLMQQPVNPQSETRLDSPFAMPLYPPSQVKADLVGGHIRIKWIPIPLERVKGYVVYRKDGFEWRRAGFSTKASITLQPGDGITTAQFSVATMDQSGLVSKKSMPVKVSATAGNDQESPFSNPSPEH